MGRGVSPAPRVDFALFRVLSHAGIAPHCEWIFIFFGARCVEAARRTVVLGTGGWRAHQRGGVGMDRDRDRDPLFAPGVIRMEVRPGAACRRCPGRGIYGRRKVAHASRTRLGWRGRTWRAGPGDGRVPTRRGAAWPEVWSRGGTRADAIGPGGVSFSSRALRWDGAQSGAIEPSGVALQK